MNLRLRRRAAQRKIRTTHRTCYAMSKPKIIIIGGPTASGKSDLAMKICAAFNGELVSADSMQVYKRLDIGTAKPGKDEQAAVRHHLIDIREPWESYSAADFVSDAGNAIDSILAEGKLPVVCGGTGLYIEGLIHPTDYSLTQTDTGLRDRLMEKDAHELWVTLYGIDPESAAKTHENNKKRVVRALEIYYTTGITKTESDKLQKKEECDLDHLLIMTGFCGRDILYDRIDRRVDKMICAGLADEVRALIESNDLRPGTTAYQAIGYKELFPYVKGEATLEECADALKQATRNYAKRQLTWFSRYDGIRTDDSGAALDAVSAFTERR